MKKRRFLASLLTTVMLLSALPAGALAAPTDGTGGNPADTSGDLFLDKTATLEKDGSYTIKMEAYSTGTSTTITETKGVPLDIVLVLDQSGSMANEKVIVNGQEMTRQELLKQNVGQFIDTVVEDGRTHQVTHRVGMVGFASGPLEGNDHSWKSTGVFDETGKFVEYQKADASATIHVPYDGELAQNGEYFVYDGSEYVNLTYNPNAQQYTLVQDPDTSRQDLFGIVDSKYQPAKYGEYVVKHEASNPAYADGKTYYDANGNQLTWIEVMQSETEYVPVQKNDLNQSQKYYIKDANGKYKVVEYRHASWDFTGILSKRAWRDSSDKEYNPSTEQFYTQKTTEVPHWVLSSDKTNPVPAGSKVYTHENKTDWNVNGTPVTDLYEKSGNGAWEYMYNGQNVALTDEQVYVTQQGANSYSGALVPVTNGENGQGEKRQSLVTATNSIMADGATRPALGIEMANKILEANPLTEADQTAGRQRIVIVFTDGLPGYSGYDAVEADRAVAESYVTKNTYGAKVYTIGLFSEHPEQQTADFLSHLSSNYPEANTTYTPVARPSTSKNYIVNIDGGYALAKYSKKWKYLRSINNNSWYEFTKSKAEFYEKADMVPGPRPDPSKDYSAVVTNPDNLTEIFQSIQQDITSSSTTVDLNEQSIIRDIMPQHDFGLELDRELTDAATVTVQIAEGTRADENQPIVWKDPMTVLEMKHEAKDPTTGGTTASAPVKVNNVDMTITASTFTKNPTTGAAENHTVDVTGFDYSQQYIAPKHPGAKLIVTIKGVKVLPNASTDKAIYTNLPQSGLWKPAVDGKFPTAPEVAFDQPTTYFPSKTYVLDYAKPLNVPLDDLKLTSVMNLDVDGFNPFNQVAPTLVIDQKYGKAEVKSSGAELTYTPQTMQWDGGDTFYAFGATNNPDVTGATANGNGVAWSKVTVIPANNVYYEDTFETNDSTGTVGITYSGEWTEETTSDAGQNSGAAEDVTNPDDNHGWIPVLKPETGDTDGSSHHANVTDPANSKNATASFTFTGTGVDIYSRTNGKTGTVMAMLADANGNIMLGKVVDTLSASDEYYQIPTLTFHEDASGNALPYGTYKVTIDVTTAAQGRYEYYLDGIRIYNPAQNNADVTDQYEPDEQNAAFVEVRDVLLDANSFSAESNTSKGAVFIDQLNNAEGDPTVAGSTAEIGVYQDLGPKNEVYLQKGQAISFKVNHTQGNHYYVGLKALTGGQVSAGYPGADNRPQFVPMSHTADMYYEVAPSSNGIISINNMGGDLLSITKLKVTNETAPVDVDNLFAPIENTVLLEETQNFYKALSEAPVDPEPAEPVPTEPVEPETTEPAEPEVTEPTAPDVDITNPEPVEPSKPTRPSIADLLEKVFGGFRGWF